MFRLQSFTRLIVLFSFAIMITFIIAPKESSAATVTYLDQMEPNQSAGSIYKNKWYSQPFVDINGRIIDRGIGFSRDYYYKAFAAYNIENMGYTTFDTRITIDKNNTGGDFGKTAVGIYADDHQLYESQLSVNSGSLNVHLDLPTNTKNLKIMIRQLSGAKGVHNVILDNARLSTGGKVLSVGEVTSLNTIGANVISGNYYAGQWYNEPFQDIKGNIITEGVGLYRGNGTGRVQYNIDQMGYNIFETKLSLDSKWTLGDFGKSAVAIYADDYKLYEKQMSTSTPVQSVRVKIPKGTKNLFLVTKQIEGARGTQGVIFINPVVKKTTEAQPVVVRNADVTSVGAIESRSYAIGQWYSSPFQYVDGSLVTSGFGLDYEEGYATFDITGMNYNTFTAKLSLDSKWLVGDYGKTSVYFYTNNRLIYSQGVTKATGIKPLFLRLPSGTTNLKVMIRQTRGALGYHGVVLGDAQFKYYSYTPSLKTTQLKATNNTGKKDVVTITKVVKGDIIKIYNSVGKLLAAPKATGSTVTVYLPQIGPKSGKLYIAAKRGTYLDSSKTAVSFGGEKTSTSKLKKVTIKNYKNRYDTITVSNLQKYDMIYVYNTTGKVIATKQATSSTATIYIKQLGKTKSYVYLAAKGSGMTTSTKVKVYFKSE
ncbi:hypothetical protein KW850_27265 [Bacillus sp. sid0103]|uniref:hypothetical protein n=1 Tax=Bacillus sp. sid0103 TaxID=2856337 RepID=UPI001C475718|nr:hypothetical protein [Bacillus sp. sid0103]MBV7508906.1 hypothetical protein [Bacillus sp. sid0103]